MAFGPVSDFRTAKGEIFLLTCRSVMTCQRRWAWGHRYGGSEYSFQSASFDVTKHPPKCLGYFNLSFLVEENKTHTHIRTRAHTHNLKKQKAAQGFLYNILHSLLKSVITVMVHMIMTINEGTD